MKIHSDILTSATIHGAVATVPGVYLSYLIPKGSRSRQRSFEFRLEGSGNRRRNSGQHGSEQVSAASWDQHGDFFANLFRLDPDAIVGPYKGVEDFRTKTHGAWL